jgi:hypothetical protein
MSDFTGLSREQTAYQMALIAPYPSAAENHPNPISKTRFPVFENLSRTP